MFRKPRVADWTNVDALRPAAKQATEDGRNDHGPASKPK
jgi:hypothetical protein